jgi:tetratricopeptide (TPR) repeat protein
MIWQHFQAITDQSAGVRTPYDDDRNARETYLTARFEFNARTAESLAAAEKGFRQLVEKYPDRAASWSDLADTYILLREFGSMSDDAAFTQATRAARTAVALDPSSADAWLTSGFVAWWWHGDSASAFPAFETAIKLNPSSSRAYHWYATALETHGEFDKSLQTIARARALDPDSRAIVADEAMIRFDSGQRTEAVVELERLEQLDPGFMSNHSYLSNAYISLGRDSDFLREAIVAAQLREDHDMVEGLRLAEKKFQEGGRQAMLEQLTASEIERMEQGHGYAVIASEYRALAGDRNGMLKWLTLAEQRHEVMLFALRCNPAFSAYRDDPAIRAILERLP